MNLLVLGPQGSGKGTQAVRISAARDIPHVSTGDMFRAAIAGGTELGLRVKAVLDAGELVSDDLTVELVRERLGRDDASTGFILDGFPRNLAQAAALDGMLESIGRRLDLVLYFVLSDEIATERMLERARAEGRADDTPDVIARRLQVYHEQTEPLVDFYERAGLLVEIEADASIDGVWSQIDAALGALRA
jgi:adenylate kinase